MLDLLQYQNFYLMGIKGVAMTSLAQILIDAGKTAAGCDVRQEFVTQEILDKLQIKIDYGFIHQLPENVDVVVYTSAHGGPNNPIVVQAKERNIPCLSQAEALAYFFNQKKGAAVCGVGGKSTVTAMIAWILTKTNTPASFSVGVGNIPGLDKTGRWDPEAEYFAAEADEYVIDPSVDSETEDITPRFSFLKPEINVCTNLQYDHPDVYLDIHHTRRVFADYLLDTNSGGTVIYNHDSEHLRELVEDFQNQFQQQNLNLLAFGTSESLDAQLIESKVENQTNIGKVKILGEEQQLQLSIPGKFNLLNALAAILAASKMGVDADQALEALKGFQGTRRRFEFKGTKDGINFYDDYAHHPMEITKTITALKHWYPDSRKIIAFQPHTFSRTKELLDDFVSALGIAGEVVLLDIFPSARETYDPEISSDILMQKIQQQYPQTKIKNLNTTEALAEFCRQELAAGDVLLTMGAGDIDKLYELLNPEK